MSKPLFRLATRADLPAIVRMLADDHLGSQREKFTDPLPDTYYEAFEQIRKDPSHELFVLEVNGEVEGTAHLIFLPSLSYQGGLRAQIESVRVDSKLRGQGLGTQFVEWLLEHAKQRGAYIAQLTTEKSRTDAHRFYEKLGFTASHVGMKLKLK
jgi:GNAT superfamily N-acetyltransferase